MILRHGRRLPSLPLLLTLTSRSTCAGRIRQAVVSVTNPRACRAMPFAAQSPMRASGDRQSRPASRSVRHPPSMLSAGDSRVRLLRQWKGDERETVNLEHARPIICDRRCLITQRPTAGRVSPRQRSFGRHRPSGRESSFRFCLQSTGNRSDGQAERPTSVRCSAPAYPCPYASILLPLRLSPPLLCRCSLAVPREISISSSRYFVVLGSTRVDAIVQRCRHSCCRCRRVESSRVCNDGDDDNWAASALHPTAFTAAVEQTRVRESGSCTGASRHGPITTTRQIPLARQRTPTRRDRQSSTSASGESAHSIGGSGDAGRRCAAAPRSRCSRTTRFDLLRRFVSILGRAPSPSEDDRPVIMLHVRCIGLSCLVATHCMGIVVCGASLSLRPHHAICTEKT